MQFLRHEIIKDQRIFYYGFVEFELILRKHALVHVKKKKKLRKRRKEEREESPARLKNHFIAICM